MKGTIFMTSLYELTSVYENLQQRLYDDEYDEQAIIDTLESIECAIEDKADGYGKIIRMLQGNIEDIKTEEKRLTARRKSLERREELLKESLFSTMKTMGTRKIQTPLFSFTISKNGGKRKLVLDCDIDELPAEYQKISIEADNEALRSLLGDNETCQYCHLEQQGESLRMK